jgi:hypothetical protein
MSYPKWKYRKNPHEGFFQQTLVANEKAEAELEADWVDDPAETGFETRVASQLHPSHITENHLHEVVSSATGAPVEATIEMTMRGDING